MAAGGGQVEPDRLDPAKLQAYPKILDIDIDILVPQFIDKWKVQLYVALRSRYLMEVLDEPEPTLQGGRAARAPGSATSSPSSEAAASRYLIPRCVCRSSLVCRQ